LGKDVDVINDYHHRENEEGYNDGVIQ